MPKLTLKKDLIALNKVNFKKLNDLVDSFSDVEKDKDFPEGTLNRNIRDVLAHLHHWHLMVLSWYEAGRRGEQPDIPAKGYNWRTIPELNKVIREQYCTLELTKVRSLLQESFENIEQIILGQTNEELFEKKRHAWTGNNALSTYLIGATSSHYDWARKLIKKNKHIKLSEKNNAIHRLGR